MSGRLSGTQTRANGGHLRHFWWLLRCRCLSGKKKAWNRGSTWFHELHASTRLRPLGRWPPTWKMDSVRLARSLAWELLCLLSCVASNQLCFYFVVFDTMQSRNSKAHLLSHSQKLNCYIRIGCTLVAFLIDILKTIKQVGESEDKQLEKNKTSGFKDATLNVFVLGDWKAQKCLAGTVQGPWGPRKNNIPYSKASAGMGTHRNYIEMIWTKTEMKYLWRTNKMMQCSNVHLNGSIVFYVDIVWMGYFEVYQSE